MRGAFLDEGTYIYDCSLGSKELGFVFLGNIRWGDANLAVVKWSQVKMLGDEHKARQKKDHKGKIKDQETRMYEYQDALRANRQLAIELQNQGLSEAAFLAVGENRAREERKSDRAILSQNTESEEKEHGKGYYRGNYVTGWVYE